MEPGSPLTQMDHQSYRASALKKYDGHSPARGPQRGPWAVVSPPFRNTHLEMPYRVTGAQWGEGSGGGWEWRPKGWEWGRRGQVRVRKGPGPGTAERNERKHSDMVGERGASKQSARDEGPEPKSRLKCDAEGVWRWGG